MRHEFLSTGLVLALVALAPPCVFGQTDNEKFQVARIAIDKYKDCKIGRAVLEEIPTRFREDAWIYYMAKSYECTSTLGDLEGAIKWYEQYDQRVSGEDEIKKKLVELRFQAAKLKDAETQKAKMTAALVNDLSGLWDDDDDGLRISQTGDKVVVTFENVPPSLNEYYGWQKYDVRFEGSRSGNLILGKYFVRVSKISDASRCSDDFQKAAIDAALEISKDGKELKILYGDYRLDVKLDYPNYVCTVDLTPYSQSKRWRRRLN